MTSFFTAVGERSQSIDSLLCLGIDPHPELIDPVDAKGALEFGRSLIDQALPVAAAVKFNTAFFEALGGDGWEALRDLIESVRSEVPVILDAKRADIGSTAEAYARALLDQLGAGAVTVSPYLGRDAVEPFLQRTGTGVFVLARTSNPGGDELQLLTTPGGHLFEDVVRAAADWGDEVGFVAGATDPVDLGTVRRLAPDAWILAPGIGAQGADLEAAVAAGIRADSSGLLLAVSRGIATASNPATEARRLRDAINTARRERAPLATTPASELAEALWAADAIRFGSFTLKSGATSPVYLDLRRLASTPSSLRTVARLMARRLRPLDFQHVAPIPLAALPLGSALALHLGASMIYPRLDTKGYGTGAAVDGRFAPGDRAVVIDDVASTGASKLEAITELEAAGLIVEDVVVAVDRSRDAGEQLAAAGYRLHFVATLDEVARALHAHGNIDEEELAAVLAVSG